MSRPKVKIDTNQLAAFMRFKPTAEDCAAYFKCSVDTIERHIKKASGLTFAEFREQNMVHTRMSLVRTALKKAEGGDNVMLIFCLKNLCGWRDKQADEGNIIVNNLSNNMTDDELDQKIKKLMGEK